MIFQPFRQTSIFIRCVINVHSLLLCILFCSTAILAEEQITVGMTAALSGLNADLGRGMKAGIELGFSEINAKGGINGKKLRLIVLDDAYEPLRAAKNMYELIDSYQVSAILGNTGTPTAVLTVPIANDKKILMLGAYTGAGLLRKIPPDCCIYNYRASYKEETTLMVNYLLDSGIKPQEIAFFTQRDSYGDAGYKGAVEQLHQRGFEQTELLVHGRYQRNTLNVEQAVADLLTANVEPKAVIMVASYSAAARFIKLARMDLPELKFLNISFTGSDSLLKALGDEAEGVIITQVVPPPHSKIPIVQNYLAQIKHSGNMTSGDFISLEGYIVARIFSEAVRHISGEINRRSILNSMEQLGKFDIGLGAPLQLSKTQRQASHRLWMTQITQGVFKVIGQGDNKHVTSTLPE